MRFDRQQVTTLLTLVIVGLWVITFVTRIWIDWPPASVLDAAMPLVLGYWFVSNAVNGGKKKTTDGVSV